MKKTSTALLLIGLFLVGLQTWFAIIADYKFERDYMQLWELADKSSTIPAKQEYIAAFVKTLEEGYDKGDFARHNAIWLVTPNNGFVNNLNALKTLSIRLNEIQKMKPTSFEYNTAIQQIAAQEQGEAGKMLAVFEGCYILAKYPVVWGWIGGTLMLIECLLFFVGGSIKAAYWGY